MDRLQENLFLIRLEIVERLLDFPSPRNQPIEAIEAKDRIRELKAEYEQCLEELYAHVQPQDALS